MPATSGYAGAVTRSGAVTDQQHEPRILVDLSLAPLGGAATYVAGLIEGLTEAEIAEKDRIVVLLSSEWAARYNDAVSDLAAAGVQVDVVDVPAPGSWRARLGRGRLLRRAVRRHRAQVAFVPRDAVPRLPVPYVMLARNLYAWQAYRSSVAVGGPMSAFLLRIVARRSAKRAAAVLVVSEAMIAAMAPGVRVAGVVHHGSSLPAVDRPESADHAPVVVMIANVIANKGIEVVIEALARVRSDGRRWSLHVHGNKVDPGYVARLDRQAVAALGASVLAGPVFGPRLAEAYRGADVVVVGGTFETFCFPLLEGMRSGCTVVAPESPLVRELCGDVAVTYREGDAASLAEALRTAWAERGERGRMGVERSRAFTWARTATQTVAVVRSVARRGEAQAAATAPHLDL